MKNWTWALALPLLCGAAWAAPAKLQLPTPAFHVQNMEFSERGDHVCITGSQSNEKGHTTTWLLLVDEARNTVQWQHQLNAPDGNYAIYPVQCYVGSDAVYLLVNVDSDSLASMRNTSPYVYRFDLSGKQTGYRGLHPEGRYKYGYALAGNGTGVNVAGYVRRDDDAFENYAVFTAALDQSLQGELVLRKTGAYVDSVGARIVGDNLYVAGNFYPTKVPKDEVIEDFSASKMRLSGNYLWSTHGNPGDQYNTHTSVAGNGTVYALANGKGTVTLASFAPDGKAAPLVPISTRYCGTVSSAVYGTSLLAVRKGCDNPGKGRVLVEIDPAARQERVLDWLEGEPQFVASRPGLWAAVAKDKGGKLVYYSAPFGGK
jgi:hypothetical protein